MRVSSSLDPASANLFSFEFYDVPFAVKRAYWIQDFVPSSVRGNHAHRNLNQIMILLKGSLELTLNRGGEVSQVNLENPGDHALIPNATWRSFSTRDSQTVVLVLADEHFDASDYIRNYEEYLDWFRRR